MARTLLLLAVAAYSVAGEACISAADVTNFAHGLLDGFEVNVTSPGSCYKAFIKLYNSTDLAVSDLEALLDGDISKAAKISSDVNAIVKQAKKLEKPCNYSGLEDQVAKVLGPNGNKILLQNYINHMSEINSSIETIKKCSTDPYGCGKAIASIISDMLAFTIYMPHEYLALE